MLKKRNVSQETALQKACEQNGLIYNPDKKSNFKSIKVECKNGKYISIDKNFNFDGIESVGYYDIQVTGKDKNNHKVKLRSRGKDNNKIESEDTLSKHIIHVPQRLIVAKRNEDKIKR